jgi:hypothetical protein
MVQYLLDFKPLLILQIRPNTFYGYSSPEYFGIGVFIYQGIIQIRQIKGTRAAYPFFIVIEGFTASGASLWKK